MRRYGLKLEDIADVRKRRTFGKYNFYEAITAYQYFLKRLGIAKSGTAPYMLESYIYGSKAKANRNHTIELDLTDEEYARHAPIVKNIVEMFAGCMKKLEDDIKAEANRRREATRYAFYEKADLLNDPGPEDAPQKPSWGLAEAMKAARDLDGLVFPENHLGHEFKMLPR